MRTVLPAHGPRPVYAYSVVPGGLHGADEAVDAVAADAVVAAHYKDVKVAALSLEAVEKPRAVHVSYRIGDKVYWTRRTVTLKPGELLLSDGKQQIRTRCGNCVSDVVVGPVSDQEPPPEVFDTPVATSGVETPGGLAPLQAYQLLTGQGGLPPALGASSFSPDVVVDITDNWSRKVESLDAHVSQFYEWLPWVDGLLDQVPETPETRREWLSAWLGKLLRNDHRAAIERRYGPESAGSTIVEAFEVCEYGRRPSPDELERMFPR